MSKELKLCPFCGAPAKIIEILQNEDDPNYGGRVVECISCYASTRVFFGEFDGLEEAWNNRIISGVETRRLIGLLREWIHGPAGDDLLERTCEALEITYCDPTIQ